MAACARVDVQQSGDGVQVTCQEPRVCCQVFGRFGGHIDALIALAQMQRGPRSGALDVQNVVIVAQR